MHYVERLPLILGALASLITGMITYEAGFSHQILYIRMAVSMVVFFFIGLIVRSTILGITKDIEKNTKITDVGDRFTNEFLQAVNKANEKDDEFQPLKVSDIINTNEIQSKEIQTKEKS